MDYRDMMGNMIRALRPAPRTADQYDTMARELAGAILSGNDAEAARLSGMLGRARVPGELTPPTMDDLAAMAERFPADRNIVGGPVKTAGQSRALSRRADVGGLTATDDMTLQDAIDLQGAMDRGVLVRGTMNADEPAMGSARDDLLEFFGTKAQKQRAGLDPLAVPTRGDVDSPIIDAIRQDQLLGIASSRAADEAAAIDALDEAGPMFPLRETRTGTGASELEDIAKLTGGGALTGGLAYALSQMGSPDEEEETVIMSQEVTDGDIGEGTDPADYAAAAEQDALFDDYEGMIADMGDGDPVNSMAPPVGRVMNLDDLRAMGVLKEPDVLEDGPSDTADLVAESRPIPASTPVAVKRTTVYRPRRTSRGRRRPNYAYSRAMNPSQRGRRR